MISDNLIAILVVSFLMVGVVLFGLYSEPLLGGSGWKKLVSDTDCGKGGCGGDLDPEQCHYSYSGKELVIHNGNLGNGGKCWAYMEIDLTEYINFTDISSIKLIYDAYSEWVGGACYIRSGVGIFEEVGCPSENQIIKSVKYNLDSCGRIPVIGWKREEEIDFTDEWLSAGKPDKFLVGAWVSSCSTYFGKLHLENIKLHVESNNGTVKDVVLYTPGEIID